MNKDKFKDAFKIFKAVHSKDAVELKKVFTSALKTKIDSRIDNIRQDVIKKMNGITEDKQEETDI